MSRYYFSQKVEADHLKKIEIWWLKKQGYLTGWKSGTVKWIHGWSGEESSIGIFVSMLGDNNYIQFNYTQTEQDGEKRAFNYKVPITESKCYFGGNRYWFTCSLSVNGKYCGRRVGVLYKGGDYFGCRHCYDLTYNSRNLGGIAKAAGQVISIPELERLESEIKRKFYAGKPTRKYLRLLKKENKSTFQLQLMTSKFGNLYNS